MKNAGGGNKPHVEILQNRTFSSTLTHAALCPKMDLVALALDRKTIVIHRFNWQRLAMISPADGSQEKINAIAWSPDGALLAVGLDSGRLALHAVDAASRQTTKDVSVSTVSRMLVSAPTSLHWAILGNKADRSRTDFLWERAYEERESPSWRSSDATETDKRARALLAVGDADGCVSIFGFDLRFAIAKTRVMPTGVCVSRVHIASAAQIVLALGKSPDGGSLLARVIPLSRLCSTHSELFRAGAEIVALSDARAQLQESISHICKRWAGSMESALKKSVERPLTDAMVEAGEHNASYGAWHVLRDAHQSATLPGAVASCLASEVGEGGAREALRTFRGGADDVDEAIRTAIAVSETLLFRASEYRGLAAVSSKFERVGVSGASAEHALESASKLFSELTALLLKFYEICSETEAFLVWLGYEAQKADKDPEDAAKVPGLSSSEQDLVSNFFFRHLADIESHSTDILSRTLRTKVLPCLEQLQLSAEKLVVTPFQAMSASLSVNIGAKIPCSGLDEKLAHISIAERVLSETIIELCIPSGKARVLTVRYLPKAEQWVAKYLHYKSASDVLVDWAHFRNNHFIVFSVDECAGNSETSSLPLRFKTCGSEVLEHSEFRMLFSNKDNEALANLSSFQVDDIDLQLLDELTMSTKLKRCTFSAYRNNASVILFPQRALLLSIAGNGK